MKTHDPFKCIMHQLLVTSTPPIDRGIAGVLTFHYVKPWYMPCTAGTFSMSNHWYLKVSAPGDHVLYKTTCSDAKFSLSIVKILFKKWSNSNKQLNIDLVMTS